MRQAETGSTTSGLALTDAPDMADKRSASSRERLSKRKVGNLTCNEGEVEDLLSEGEST